MRYRTKLIVVFLAVALVTNGISLLVMDRLSLHYLYEGYRALAAILLGVLLWWAWRQAVPPRKNRRSIYDGPSAATAT